MPLSQKASDPLCAMGAVVDWQVFARLLHSVFYEQLGFQEEQVGNVLVTEALFTSKVRRRPGCARTSSRCVPAGDTCCGRQTGRG